jgi:hypothetical protein
MAATKSAMPEAKWWGHSITIWGAIITGLSTVLPALGPVLGIDITGDLVREAGEGCADGAGCRRPSAADDDLWACARQPTARAAQHVAEV